MAFDLSQRARIVNPSPNVDIHWGPYSSTTEASNQIGSALLTSEAVGKTIGVKTTGDTIVEYRWEKTSGGTYDWVLADSGTIERVEEIVDEKVEYKSEVYSLIPLYSGESAISSCHALVL